MKIVHLALAASMAAVTTSGLAGIAPIDGKSEAFMACAEAASSQYEPGYADIGRDSSQIDIAAATEACQAALAEDPASLQVKAWLGRVYDVADDPTNALPLLEEAANGGVPLALTIYGDLLIVGEQVPLAIQRQGGRLVSHQSGTLRRVSSHASAADGAVGPAGRGSRGHPDRPRQRRPTPHDIARHVAALGGNTSTAL